MLKLGNLIVLIKISAPFEFDARSQYIWDILPLCYITSSSNKSKRLWTEDFFYYWAMLLFICAERGLVLCCCIWMTAHLRNCPLGLVKFLNFETWIWNWMLLQNLYVSLLRLLPAHGPREDKSKRKNQKSVSTEFNMLFFYNFQSIGKKLLTWMWIFTSTSTSPDNDS